MHQRISMASLVDRISIQDVQNVFWQLLLFLMIILPRNGQSLKFFIIGVIFTLSIITIISSKKILVSKQVFVFLSLHLTYAIYSGFLGLLNSNPGAFSFIRVNIIYYVVLFISLGTFFNNDVYDKSITTISYAALFIEIYSLLIILVNIGLWPESLFIDFDVTSNIGIHYGYIHITNTNLSMMLFIFPFLTILYLNNYQFRTNRKIIFFILIFAGFIILLSGRRILWGSLALPFIYFFIKPENLKNKIKFIGVLSILIGISFVYLTNSNLLNIQSIFEHFVSAFSSSTENVRYSQAKALLDGFYENPVLGTGAGVGVEESIRSIEAPWLYELSYHLILYNSGVIGFLLFAISHLYILFNLFLYTKKGFKIAEGLLLAYITILIANATNPYFTSSFDFLWFIIFPVIFFHRSKKQKNIIKGEVNL